MVDLSANFAGSIPEYYDKCLGPAWFEAFAADLAQRLPVKPASHVLELACGTGIVTRRLRERIDPTLRLVASDLSKPMLNFARSKLIDYGGIDWREADAASLPFDDGEFGAVVCAFGIMFVPDKRAAVREARRVLRKGGILLFNVWDRIEHNRHVALTAGVMEELFPGDEELSFRRLYKMYDPALLRALLAEAAFQEVRIEQKQIEIHGVSASGLMLVGALQLLQLRAQERLARDALAVVEHDLVGLAGHGAARAAQDDEVLGFFDPVAGFAQLEAQVIRSLFRVVGGAVADELRAAELLDRRDELLDLARFDRGRHRESGASPYRDRSCENRKGRAHRFRTAYTR